MDPKTLGLIRHIVGTLSTLAISFGLLSEDIASQLVEAILSLAGAIGLIWTVIASWKAPEKQK